MLEIISRGGTYGYEITRQLNILGFSDVVEGTVYAILARLEAMKYLKKQKADSESGGPPRNLYLITEIGQTALIRFWDKWEFVTSRVEKLKNKQNLGIKKD